MTIPDKTVRTWAQDHGEPVGGRGPLSSATVEKYRRWHLMTLEQRLAQVELRLRELEAERSEDKAIIAAMKREIDDLRRDRDLWKDAAITLSQAIHSTD